LTFSGSNPTLGKSTRIALTLTGDREFSQRDKSEWDIRLHHQEGNTLTIQVGGESHWFELGLTHTIVFKFLR